MNPMAYTAFVEELIKLSFDEEAAAKVLQVVKGRTVKAVRNYMGAAPMQNVKRNLTAIGRRVANLGAPEEVVSQVAGPGAIAQAFNAAPIGHPTRPVINVPKRGDALRFLTGEIGAERIPAAAQVASNPRSRKMLDAVIKGHELDETIVPQGLAAGMYGHRNMDVILREHNRIATLPSEHQAVRDMSKQLRDLGGESQAIKGYVDYGNGPRLSRHARRRIVEGLERDVDDSLRHQFAASPAAYEHPSHLA